MSPSRHASAQQKAFVRPSNWPTQSKVGLEWATRRLIPPVKPKPASNGPHVEVHNVEERPFKGSVKPLRRVLLRCQSFGAEGPYDRQRVPYRENVIPRPSTMMNTRQAIAPTTIHATLR